jgi:hypothetical protein
MALVQNRHGRDSNSLSPVCRIDIYVLEILTSTKAKKAAWTTTSGEAKHVAWDFYFKAVSPKVPKCSPDSNSKAVSNMYSNVLRYSTFKVLLSYTQSIAANFVMS